MDGLVGSLVACLLPPRVERRRFGRIGMFTVNRKLEHRGEMHREVCPTLRMHAILIRVRKFGLLGTCSPICSGEKCHLLGTWNLCLMQSMDAVCSVSKSKFNTARNCHIFIVEDLRVVGNYYTFSIDFFFFLKKF